MPPLRPSRSRLTHFLCLPLVTPASRSQWQASLKTFLDDIKATATDSPSALESSPVLHPEMVRLLGTLHITIGVMALSTPDLERTASAVLHGDVVRKILTESMGADIAKKNVRGGLSGAEIKTDDDDYDEDEDENEDEVISPISRNQGSADSSRDVSTTNHTTPTTTINNLIDPTSKPISTNPLTTTFSGLRAMHSPAQTSILFAPPTDADSRIRHLCESLQGAFQAANLMLPEKRPLTVHATILNTIYAPKNLNRTFNQKPTPKVGTDFRHPQHHAEKDKKEGEAVEDGGKSDKLVAEPQPPPGPPKNRRTKTRALEFDATALLDRYAAFEWARDVQLERVCIWKMGARKVAKKEGDEEEYEELDSVTLLPPP